MSFSVNTRFDVGDKVWYISDNKVKETDVTGVSITVDSDENISVEYTLHFNDKISEKLVYSSKEELISSL